MDESEKYNAKIELLEKYGEEADGYNIENYFEFPDYESYYEIYILEKDGDFFELSYYDGPEAEGDCKYVFNPEYITDERAIELIEECMSMERENYRRFF